MRSAMLEALGLSTEDAATAVPVKPVVWTSEEWVAYFEHNATNLMPIPWGAGAGATREELAEIIESLRAWQLGETSDGARLTRAAERHAAQTYDPAYVEAIRRFIAEEQRHGEMLGRFLDLAGVPRKGRDWGDSIFRLFRHLRLRMEVWTTVVVMVEVHAMLYYAAVRRATGSAVLRRICHQILRDEVPHLRFQCERLAIIHRNRGHALRALTMGVQRVLFAGVTLAIWAGHRRALRAGGLTFRRFWGGAWAQMGKAWRAMDPRGYTWPKGRGG
ncbi:ferritin-like domain-containing protein [Gemmata sp. JC673]|uniref:Ferritin-like domain-containing protein n=1 Tax=Gemmata algarum TaxID=2975278 RepID=A0ABU5EVP2_9BACT|nr:ferritin-like domain-containing protein [Gemmata algarum]MDY3557786.1 ferritin-like domain-containing protein [Gemmata algarum]